MLCFPCPVTEFACFAFGRGRGKLHPSAFLFHQFSTIHIKTYLPFHLPLPSLSCTPEPSYKDTRAQTRRTLQAARWGRTEEHSQTTMQSFVALDLTKLKVSIIAPTLYHCQHTFCQFQTALVVGGGGQWFWSVRWVGVKFWASEYLLKTTLFLCSQQHLIIPNKRVGENLLAYCLRVLSSAHTYSRHFCRLKDIWQGG